MGMTIGEIEKFIKSRKDEQIIVSPRVETKLKERGLDCKIIKEKLLNNNILGIVNQGGEVYKTWIEYNSHQDLEGLSN